MQARLPDINSAIVSHRSNAILGFKTKDYHLAIISIDAINALLPDDYKIEVSTEKYNELIQERDIIECSECGKEHPRHTVKEFEKYLNFSEQVMTGKKTEMAWMCPSCFNIKPLIGSNFKTVKFSNPTYLKIMPDAPKRSFGVISHLSFDGEFRNWFRIALQEIESSIGKYRAEYASQNSEDMLQQEIAYKNV